MGPTSSLRSGPRWRPVGLVRGGRKGAHENSFGSANGIPEPYDVAGFTTKEQARQRRRTQVTPLAIRRKPPIVAPLLISDEDMPAAGERASLVSLNAALFTVPWTVDQRLRRRDLRQTPTELVDPEVLNDPEHASSWGHQFVTIRRTTRCVPTPRSITSTSQPPAFPRAVQRIGLLARICRGAHSSLRRRCRAGDRLRRRARTPLRRNR